MRLLWILALAATASAAEFPYESRSFWEMHYRFPRSYCEYRIGLSVEDPKALISAASACEFSQDATGVSTVCRLPREESSQLAAKLRHMGKLTHYNQSCSPEASYPELYYKRDNLRREWEEIGVSSRALVSISGLMATELEVLDNLISQYEGALDSILTVEIRMAKSDGIETGRRRQVRPIPSVPVAKKGPSPAAVAWQRQTIHPCQQVKVVTVTFQRSGTSDQASLRDTASRYGKPYDDRTCPFLNRQSIVGGFLVGKSESDMRRALVKLSGFRSWSTTGVAMYRQIVPDDERYDRLSAELASQRELLANAPHVRAFVSAEIERVASSAETVRELRQGSLVIVAFDR